MTGKRIRSYTIKSETDLLDEWDTIVVTPNDTILANSKWLEGVVQYIIRKQGRCGHCGEWGHKIKDCKERNADSQVRHSGETGQF